jgi:ribose transport system permease protein
MRGGGRATGRPWLGLAERYALLLVLVAVCVLFSVLPQSSGTFATRVNFATFTSNEAMTTTLAIAALFPLVAGHFDFSIAAIMSISGLTCAAAMSRFGAPLGVAVLLAIALGAAIGLVNGVLVARIGMSAIVTTLAVSTLIAGFIQWYTNGLAVATGISSSLTDFGSLSWFGVPRILYAVALVGLLSYYVLAWTPLGRQLYAIGSNERAARLVGINAVRNTIVSFVLTGTICGVAGVFLLARQGSAGTDSGTGFLFPAYAAVFLGATAITPGRFNVLGTFIGVELVAASVSGLTLAGASSWVSPVFNGAALLVAVALATVLRRRRGAGTDPGV